MLSFRTASSGGLAAATLLAGVILAAPLPGSAANVEKVAVNTRATQARPHDVESRIKTLHGELHITPEQEAAWKNVADVMRENAKTMDDFRSQDAQAERTATAPDMISAYGKATDAHADAIKKFATAFAPLYDAMPPAQKKTADTVFRRRVEDSANRQAGPKS
jgi:hypothetical protein